MQSSWNFAALKTLTFSAIVAAMTVTNSTPASALTTPVSSQPLNGGASAAALRPFDAQPLGLSCAVQFRSTIPADSSELWDTYNWNPKLYVVWTIMDDSQPDSGPSVTISNVAVDRNTASTATYWLKIENTSAATKAFEVRFCTL